MPQEFKPGDKISWDEQITRMGTIVAWEQLIPGETIYYRIPRIPKFTPIGPFVVIDPTIFRLRNMGGVEMNLPAVMPIRLYEPGTSPTPVSQGALVEFPFEEEE